MIENINVEDIYAFVVLIISSIHLHVSFSGSWGVAGAYPSCVRGRAHPRQSDAGKTIHTHIMESVYNVYLLGLIVLSFAFYAIHGNI